MSLLDLAEADNAFLLEDADAGFGVAIKLTSTSGAVYSVVGQVTRVGVDVDPNTGLIMPGNRTGITARLSRFPQDDQPDEGWLVETKDTTGAPVIGKAQSVMLDRTAGRATFLLRR